MGQSRGRTLRAKSHSIQLEDFHQFFEATDEFTEEQAQLIYLTSRGVLIQAARLARESFLLSRDSDSNVRNKSSLVVQSVDKLDMGLVKRFFCVNQPKQHVSLSTSVFEHVSAEQPQSTTQLRDGMSY
eukprot:5542216-Amphidinium_carterae.4